MKEWNPDFPIMLGGWHPSLLPTQTLEASYVDYVVRGQGEESLLELVQHLESGSALDLVAGIGFKRDGKLIFTAERPLRPLAGYASQGISPCGLRRVRTSVRTALGDVYLEPGVSLQLRILHERGRLRPQMECAVRRAVCRGNRGPHAALQPGDAVGRGR